MHHMKFVDESLTEVPEHALGTATCDPMIGHGRWHIKRAGTDMSYLLKPHELGEWGPAEHDKR